MVERNSIDAVQAVMKATTIGYGHGEAAASWVELDDSNARTILDGIEDGDPEILDSLPYPDLSGEWADGYRPTDLYNDACDYAEIGETSDDESAWLMGDLCSAYEEGFNAAVQEVVSERCRRYL